MGSTPIARSLHLQTQRQVEYYVCLYVNSTVTVADPGFSRVGCLPYYEKQGEYHVCLHNLLYGIIFAEKCMKNKKMRLRGKRSSLAALDPPLRHIQKYSKTN